MRKIDVILALILAVFVSCAGAPPPAAKASDELGAFALYLDKALSPDDDTVSFVFLAEFGGAQNNQLLSEFLTGQIKKLSKARFIDRNSMDRILEERSFAYQGFLDDSKFKYLADFWPSRYIMTGYYGRTGETLTVKLKVVDIITAELVVSQTVDIPMPADTWSHLDPAAAEAAALRDRLVSRNLAMASYESKKYIDAIPLLERYQKNYPGDVAILGALIESYVALEQRQEAIRVALEYEKAAPCYDAYYLLGRAYSWYDAAKSIEYLKKAIAARGEVDQWLLWTLACQYDWGYNDKRTALMYLDKAYEIAKANKDTEAMASYEEFRARLR